MATLRLPKSTSPSADDPASTVEVVLAIVVIALISYAVYVDFDWFAFLGAIVITSLAFFGMQKALKTFAEHDSAHFTVVGLLIVFVASFECTKHATALYHALAVMVIVCVISLFLKTLAFATASIFIFAYLACLLLVQHVSGQKWMLTNTSSPAKVGSEATNSV